MKKIKTWVDKQKITFEGGAALAAYFVIAIIVIQVLLGFTLYILDVFLFFATGDPIDDKTRFISFSLMLIIIVLTYITRDK